MTKTLVIELSTSCPTSVRHRGRCVFMPLRPDFAKEHEKHLVPPARLPHCGRFPAGIGRSENEQATFVKPQLLQSR